ncbi:thiamine pyrophosphate-dependent dehydrogenase E1 component subunit alpha [Nocardioides sp. Soil796]|uniref:thiamine pyrophosphate-dependent dehydrogenase E1 component subunit alpha n=1 Tax=Nocardioides sp. Soil796 TaxID=1736412 RepID=UPI00070E81C6|nr:thiamine pyrophosphate-dependent dehydrogenase E1 component subunit alpha [Nocardioides sp. Soil796]KRF16857.1 hypothetical protein ASH02_02000 [Nocardioides sp. Soil796]
MSAASALLETPEGRQRIWSSLVTARAFDQAMCEHNNHWHEARGEEAVIVGGFLGLGENDVVAPHFRGACAVSLFRGADPETLAAGVFGTAGSNSLGHWRGDICPHPDSRSIGMFSGSLGTTVAYATGAALHLQRTAPGNVAVCAFGDGTANAGIVSESMNLAVMLHLPIVLICQNNQFATSLRASDAIAGGPVSARARGFGLPSIDVDGNDVRAVLAARDDAVAKAREGGGPTFIHATTYRMGGHYMNDPENYRTAEEVASWAQRDPLDRFAAELVALGELGPEEAASGVRSLTERMTELVGGAKGAGVGDVVAPLGHSAYAEHQGWAS